MTELDSPTAGRGAPVAVASPEDLQARLGEDLQRVSVLSFHAEWAEPCKAMNEVIRELAKKHAEVLFLEIEAEALPDISESFEVESVPYFVLLRGHTLLDTIQGAQATALSAAVEKHAAKKSVIPLSKTAQKPEAPPAHVPKVNGHAASAMPGQSPNGPAPPEDESDDALTSRCQKLMTQAPVVLFMKGDPDTPRCGFSQKIVKILQDNGSPFATHDILQDEGARQKLKILNEWPTFPQLIIGGEFVGGLDIVQEMQASGELKELIDGATGSA